MKKLKTTRDHTIYEKRSGRYAVKDKRKRWVQGDDKVAVLRTEGLLKTPEPKAAPAEPEAETAEGTETEAAAE
ncbi:hypothetical protein [Halochromatium roseum]|jgi:hypothetical protein|uniref:hypothetical protein n=1 Tax=Halochromatium roseum TaxID=391920 RepID=UPI001911267F|nr:hypothetical protein [Halochromatium roseum]MBK5941783.1 hypothetical protein [Halochromatium roseum]